MIILDTNVISELMKVAPNKKVITWIDQQESSELFISTITIAEISYGICALANGRRKNTLKNAFSNIINEGFEYRILDFNEKAAELYGNVMAYRKSLGRPLGICDGQIAAIALLYNYTIATRNINDFKDCNIKLINPFA